MDATKIGLRIQEVRKSRGLTQAELAQVVDITSKYLSNVECGSKIPKMTTFIAIANSQHQYEEVPSALLLQCG